MKSAIKRQFSHQERCCIVGTREEFGIGSCVGFTWMKSQRNVSSFAFEMRIKTLPGLCKNEKSDMKN